MTVEHAHTAIRDFPNEPEAAYASMVLAQRTGARKSLQPPKSFGIDADQAKHVRELIDHELLRGVPITVEPSPIGSEENIGAPPERYSATLLTKAEKCLLSAKLSREHDATGEDGVRGHLFHQCAAALTLNALREGLASYEPTEARALAADMLEEPEEVGPLALSVYFDVLDMIERWAALTTFWLDAIPHVEELFTRAAGDVTISGRIDLVMIRGGLARIRDYKTGKHLPSQEEFEARLQTFLYAWQIADLYRDVESFDIAEVYTRWGVERGVVLARDQLKIERYLTASAGRIRSAYATGEFVATPGSHCDNCPMPSLCPLPPELRPDAAIESEGHARDALAWVIATSAQVSRVRTALGGYVRRSETPVIVGDQEARLSFERRREVKWPELEAAMREADINPEEFIKMAEYTKFDVRKVGA